jgi:hypothetical protein
MPLSVAVPPVWELFDLTDDPYETRNLYHDPRYQSVIAQMKDELRRQQAAAGNE